MKEGGRRIELDEDGEEITAVHSDDLESRPTLPPQLRGSSAPVEGTVALPSARVLPPRDEHTVLLAADGLPPEEEDRSWATVVLPGGGYPAHMADRTQLLAVDEPGAPQAVDPMITENLPGMGASSLDPPRSITVPAVPVLPSSRPAAGEPLAARFGHPPPVTPPTGGYPTVGTGGYPIVDAVSSGGYPVVPARGRPAAPGRPRPMTTSTGAVPVVAARPDESTRLAWGFFVGVLIAIAIVGSAVALVMLVMQ
ncbi:hypothetical protein [Paraliomyxa miuraensis]|uniref:hypothetical protein n=1 Tax=Paraliomyxa miuraensis TaxID=376150 RepID=UPI002258C70B|nr:hypothetical protein [Paraliomyxa miuraensis]MCX4245088.1 hypothetical protein [Paraliomyxa miuraensis]